jgi:hypothetical protein
MSLRLISEQERMGADQSAQQAQSAAIAQQLQNGDIVIQLDPENHQVIFAVAESDLPPIAFDLNTGTIINAKFEGGAAQSPVM